MHTHLGNAWVSVYLNKEHQEYRAEAYIENLRAPAGVIGYSSESPHTALANLHHGARELQISFYISHLDWRITEIPPPPIQIRGRDQPR